MYILYKIFSKISKILSNTLVVVAIPISIILVVGFTIVVFLQNFLDGIGLWKSVEEQLISSNTYNVLQYSQLTALILLCIIIVCWVIFIISWCIKKCIFKKIGDMYIARNKEYRNNDINNFKERLEKYRYRD